MFIVFILTALLALVSGLGLLLLKNPIHCALSLVANLLAIAVMFAMLDAHFLAAVQIIVYAGAIMVLVLFMLMLLNVKSEKPSKNQRAWGLLGFFVGLLFLWWVVPLVNSTFNSLLSSSGKIASSNLELEGSVEAMGLKLFSEYVFLFQAAGVLLTVAVVGAVLLAKRSYR